MKITPVLVEWRQSTKGGRSTLMRQMAIELSRLENVEVCILIPSASPEDNEDAQNAPLALPKSYDSYAEQIAQVLICTLPVPSPGLPVIDV